ncbi:hypothetical protein LshimejAT787_0402010 [Lyophyllum shimeji]|uniref:Uncharacterized protein n=1 Tax=Lyophyllum shimeji TaxID=47721 RepID=A0A9P3UMU5_LYOSH|nr:hypothetical protein LshimejAT787_0402010 [Lyophyllum shimeji]
MTSISSIETVTPGTLSSLPNSPGISHERTSLAESESRILKGKRRAVDSGYDSLQDDETTSSPYSGAYPPTNDEEAETRRVEENLRRWEAAERQRRKAARESAYSSPSLVSDVSRRASLLLSGNRSRHKNDSSLGNHVALRSQENISEVPLEDINATPTPSASPSPSPSPKPRDSTDTQNPFANPPEPLSPFADPLQISALMSPSMDDPSAKRSSDQVPVAGSSASKRAPPGPPMPLGLPAPRTPPPPVDAPPQSKPPPSLSRSAKSTDDPPKETRWWHDWLCGCGEGPDRGGDYQAGRTNPFE